MARLPQPGGDAGNWGTILNEYLSQSLKADGTLHPLTSASLAAGSVLTAKLADGAISESKLDAALAAKINALSDPSEPISLSGDVTGTTDASVVGKVNGMTVSGTPTAGQVFTASSATEVSWADPAISSSVTLSGDVTGTNTASVVGALNGITVSGTPTASQVLTATNAGSASWGDGGAVTMNGDVRGSSSASIVRRINGVAVSGTPGSGKVLKATSPTAARWQADALSAEGEAINITGNYTAKDGDIVFADCSGGIVEVTLPTPVSGGYVTVKKTDNSSHVLSVLPSGSAHIDGSASWATDANRDNQQFISDGTNWYLVKVTGSTDPPNPGTGVQSRSAYEFLETVSVCAKLGQGAVYGANTNAIKQYLSYLGVRYLRTNNASGDRTISQAEATMGTAIGDGITRKMHTQILNANTSSESTIREAVNQRLNFHINGGIITDLASLESLNEHDGGNPAGWDTDLRKIQPVLYSVVKNHTNTYIKNNLKVMSPAIIGNNLDVTAQKLQNDMDGNPLYESFDFGNLHSYPGGRSHDTDFPTKAKGQFFTWTPSAGDPVPSSASDFSSRIKLYTHYITKNQRPIIVTETGYHDYRWPAGDTNLGHYSTPQEAGGMLMPRMLLEHFRIGISRTHLYELMDQPEKADENSSIGLIKTNGNNPYTFTPKKWAKAVHNLTSILADNTPLSNPGKLPFTFDAGALTNTDFKFMPMLFQKSDGSYWIVIWRRVEVAERQADHNCTLINPIPAAKPVTITFGSSITVSSVKRYTVEYETDDVTPSNITLDNRAFTINVGPKVELIKVVLS